MCTQPPRNSILDDSVISCEMAKQNLPGSTVVVQKTYSKQAIMAYSVITFLVPKILTFLILDLQNSNQRDYALSSHNYERRWSLQAGKGTWSDHQENVKIYPF